MNRLTRLESESLTVLEQALDFWCAGAKFSRMDLAAMLGTMRDMKVKLENKKFGCPTGLHSSTCLCTSENERGPIRQGNLK